MSQKELKHIFPIDYESHTLLSLPKQGSQCNTTLLKMYILHLRNRRYLYQYMTWGQGLRPKTMSQYTTFIINDESANSSNSEITCML
jgi:hypothetical protein